jgi:hypothetical protein
VADDGKPRAGGNRHDLQWTASSDNAIARTKHDINGNSCQELFATDPDTGEITLRWCPVP